jgi:hypothetical protein
MTLMTQNVHPIQRTPIPTEQDTGWVPELVWTFWRRKVIAPARNQTTDHPTHRKITLLNTLFCLFNLKAVKVGFVVKKKWQ